MDKIKLNKTLVSKYKKIKLVLCDVDGVLTDGGMYYSKKGEILKKFHTRDGMAIELLSKHGIKTGFITKEKSLITKSRAEKVNAFVFLGIKNKELELKKICRKFKITTQQIAYIGDDINDTNIMKQVGFSAVPNDGMNNIKNISDYICKTKGGRGVLREVADLIIQSSSKG